MAMSNFSGIYGITDDALLPGAKLLVAVEQALQSGISMLQYRSKNSSQAQCLSAATQLQALCKRYQTPLIINDNVALCQAVAAAGVHLGKSDASIEQARAALGEQAIIGVTCHDSIEGALQAQQRGASYVAFGRFFKSTSKPDAPGASLSVLPQARARLTIPIVAIGGINADNCAAVIAAGADMVAVINYLFASDDVPQRVAALNKAIQAIN